MTLFIISAVVLVIVFLVFASLPFWLAKRIKLGSWISNPEVVKQRLSELEVEKQEALLSESDFEEAVIETKLGLADELSHDAESELHAQKKVKHTILVAIALLPIAIVAWVYSDINQLAQLKQWQQVQTALPELGQKIVVQANQQVSREELADFALALRTKLHTQKDDAVGWLLLGRVLTSLSDMEGAIEAFSKSIELQPDRPGTLFSFAQTLLLTSDKGNVAKAQRILQTLTDITPEDNNVLGLLAVAYTRNNEPEKAISTWQTLQGRVSINDPMQRTIAQQLAALQTKGREVIGTEAVSNGAGDGTELKVVVSVAPDIQVKLTTARYLFVFVQDADSDNRMPVAVKKIPLTNGLNDDSVVVTLNNNNAMLAEFTLSDIVNGRLVARLSEDENVTPQRGEFQGQTVVAIKHGQSTEYSLQIDEELM